MTPFRRGWRTDDPDDTDNAQYVPDDTPSVPPAQHDPQTRLDDFADRLEDRSSQDIIDEQRRMDAQQREIIDIDRLMAEKQGLRQGTLDPYADPEGVVAKRQAELKPYLDSYATLCDIARMWGLSLNGYTFPRNASDEEIEAFLGRMKADIDQRISRKKRFGW